MFHHKLASIVIIANDVDILDSCRQRGLEVNQDIHSFSRTHRHLINIIDRLVEYRGVSSNHRKRDLVPVSRQVSLNRKIGTLRGGCGVVLDVDGFA